MQLYNRRASLILGSSLLLTGLSTKSFGFGLPVPTGLPIPGGGGDSNGMPSMTGVLDDPIFQDKSIGEVYVATSRLIHLTTSGIGKGMLSAVKALEIKTEKDIPAYLNDLDAVEMPNSFTGQVKERDAEIIKFASDNSTAIKDKLKSGFSLSDKAKLALQNSYSEVGLAEIFQGKAGKGGGNFLVQIGQEGDIQSTALKLKNILKLDLDLQAFIKVFASFGSDVSDLFSSVSGILDVKEAIKSAEDMSDVKLAKAEFLEDSANSTIDESVTNDLEQFAT